MGSLSKVKKALDDQVRCTCTLPTHHTVLVYRESPERAQMIFVCALL
jgi:hypothetical protein